MVQPPSIGLAGVAAMSALPSAGFNWLGWYKPINSEPKAWSSPPPKAEEEEEPSNFFPVFLILLVRGKVPSSLGLSVFTPKNELCPCVGNFPNAGRPRKAAAVFKGFQRVEFKSRPRPVLRVQLLNANMTYNVS